MKTKTTKNKAEASGQKLTELVFVLDRSGSMSGLETDTIGGYNNLLKEQKESGYRVNVTTVLFDNQYELLHNNLDIQTINPLTAKDYSARGSTALLDAMGRTITDKRTAIDLAASKPDKVLFVVITDGLENASREFTLGKVKDLIEAQKKASGWEFLFLGANIDAVATAKAYGIDENHAVRYECDSRGLKTSYRAVSKAIQGCMAKGKMCKGWADEIADDYAGRKKQ